MRLSKILSTRKFLSAIIPGKVIGMKVTSFYLRVICLAILTYLTWCYLFGGVIHDWSNLIATVFYGFAMNELSLFTANQLRHYSKSSHYSFAVALNIFAFVYLAPYIIFQDAVEVFWNFISGTIYGIILSALWDFLKTGD